MTPQEREQAISICGQMVFTCIISNLNNMKRSILWAFLALILASCTYTLPDGRKYQLTTTCVAGHYKVEHHDEYVECIGCWRKTLIHKVYDDSSYVCDETREDTIWILKTK